MGSLFSGIGGLEKGLEDAGLGRVVWQIEKDAFCRTVLERHWPSVTRYEDVVRATNLARCDVVCGGFPCQDLSDASRGRRKGLDGERSGLWKEMRRIIKEGAPRWVVVENVSGSAERLWLPVVRRDLWKLGYASLPLRVSAADVGAPHEGARCYVVATSDRQVQPALAEHGQVAFMRALAETRRKNWGPPSPRALGVADGLPGEMARLKAYANAVVPACGELIGRVILELEAFSQGRSRRG